MVVPKAISSSSWFGDIMEIHGESLCLCFADVAGITLRITHPQFRLHSQSLHFFSVFPLLRKQFIFSFLSNLFVLLSMLRWDLRVSVSPLHITGRISALRTLKAHRCAEIWPNLGCIFSRMGDIGGMKPLWKANPAVLCFGHFQVASPLDAAFGMKKMIVKFTFDLSPENQRHFDSE